MQLKQVVIDAKSWLGTSAGDLQITAAARAGGAASRQTAMAASSAPIPILVLARIAFTSIPCRS